MQGPVTQMVASCACLRMHRWSLPGSRFYRRDFVSSMCQGTAAATAESTSKWHKASPSPAREQCCSCI